MAETVASRSLRVAGQEFDQAIVEYLRERFSLRIGTQTAERLKIEIGARVSSRAGTDART